MTNIPTPTNDYVKSCCAALYESDWAKLLLGDSFHPGGVALTHRIGELLGLQPGRRLLDVASGIGTSSIYMADTFGCEVVGVDYGAESVATGVRQAHSAGISSRVQFKQGDAEQLPFEDNSFDAILCECAFCTFPDKETAAKEFARVLKPGGKVGLSDLTRREELPASLQGLLAWITCIADAQPLADYVMFMENAGIAVTYTEPQNQALSQLVRDIQGKLLGAELLVKLKKLELPNADFAEAKRIARAAAETIRVGKLGYAIIIGVR